MGRPTVKVVSSQHPDLPFVIINESDFDPSIHSIYQEGEVKETEGKETEVKETEVKETEVKPPDPKPPDPKPPDTKPPNAKPPKKLTDPESVQQN